MTSPRATLGLVAVVLALVVGAVAGVPAAAGPPPAPATAAQLVTLELGAGGGLRVVDVESAPGVQLPSSESAGRSTADPDVVTVEVVGDDGRVTYRRSVEIERFIRSEFPVESGSDDLTHRRVPHQPSFTVALPSGAGDRVRVSRVGSTSRAVALTVRAARAGEPVVVPLPGYTPDDPANRVDLVILGDGYTAAEQADFASDAAEVADGLLDLAPYSTYADALNVVGVFAPSAQSGADHPPYQAGCPAGTTHPISCCPDSTAPASGYYRTTRYESTYCYYGIQRLMVPTDEAQVYADATAAYPAWDQLMLVVNDPEYGGAGGGIATTSLDPAGVEVMKHELGHSLLWLDDEYTDDTPGYPGCTDIGRRPDLGPCLANVTDATTRGALKWNRWVAPSTPVPTSPPKSSDVAGLFLGAHYSSSTYYRSCDECLMRFLDRPFGAVAAEQLPVRLYAGGWQGPAAAGNGRIELVEPGSASPAPATTLDVPAGSSQTFGVRVLAPGSGLGTRVRWLVDGVEVRSTQVASGTVDELTWVSPDGGNHSVRVEATDVAGVLHPTLERQSLSFVRWRVGAGPEPRELLTNGGFEKALSKGWQRSKVAASVRVCGGGVAASGSCAVRLVGSPSTTRSLTGTPAPDGLPGDLLTLRASFDPANLTADAKIIATVRLVGGGTQRLTLDRVPRDKSDRAGYRADETSITLAGTPEYLQVRVQLGKGKGKLLVDGVSLKLTEGGPG